jgi:hypothetical protein
MNTLNKTGLTGLQSRAHNLSASRLTRLMAGLGYLALAALPVVILARSLSMTDLNQGWFHAFIVAWKTRDMAWSAAWIACVFWSIPLLLNSIAFLLYAANPGFKGNPWSLTLPGGLFGAYPLYAALIASALTVLVAISPALVILVGNWADVWTALREMLLSGASDTAGFAPLAWSFVVATAGLRILGVVISRNGNNYDDYGYDPVFYLMGLPGNNDLWVNNPARVMRED